MRKLQKFWRTGVSWTLAVALTFGGMSTAFAASTDPNASSSRELANAWLSQQAATQGMVLLENKNNSLPISNKSGTKIALFGTGAYATIKGGTGSGDVYLKAGANINVLQGFVDAGYDVVTNDLLAGAKSSFLADRNAEYVAESKANSSNRNWVYNEIDYTKLEKSSAEVTEAAKNTDTAVYVIARNSGEGSDRTAAKGDYYLTDNEKANLTLLGKTFKNVIVVLNTGGILDTNFFNGKGNFSSNDEFNRGKIEGLDSLLLMSQAGMNGGPALVQVLNGKVNPSGKLTDTWAIDYKDYPSSATFAKNDNDTNEEVYSEDIYVGYRYFDTFGKDVAYEFGYGLSYTDFNINVKSVAATSDKIIVKANVSNKGKADGKEVVEVYFSAPEGNLENPFQELAGYEKVSVAAGKSKNVSITFDTKDMSSYDEQKEAYVLEAGTYKIRVGNSSRNTIEAASIKLDKDVATEYCKNELGLTKKSMEAGNYSADFVMKDAAYAIDLLDKDSVGYGEGINPSKDGLTVSKAQILSLNSKSFGKAVEHKYLEGFITTYTSSNDTASDSYKYGLTHTNTSDEQIKKVKTSSDYTLLDVVNGKITTEQLVASMSNVELADLVEGGTYQGLAPSTDSSNLIGSQAESVYGAAGETTSNLYNSTYIPNIVLSDGPAGIRITNSYVKYDLVPADAAFNSTATYYTATYSWSGAKYTVKVFNNEAEYKAEIATGTSLYTTTGQQYYQYCTAFPIGTLLAQTWDKEVIEEVGRAVAVEMLEYGVTVWLAPGMNIHRNPLCGRNFEYYSEDPMVVGVTCAAITKGIQTKEDGSNSGVGVSIKHFAFNNQESQRRGSNSVVSERAAREIYLKGFEYGIKHSSPMTIMSSYNMVNGISTFENYGLLTEITRNEWGFDGFIMTDWFSVSGVNTGSVLYGQNVQRHLMYAGNDCEMPGNSEKGIFDALQDGTLRLGDLQRSAINMINVIKNTAVFADLQEKLAK